MYKNSKLYIERFKLKNNITKKTSFAAKKTACYIIIMIMSLTELACDWQVTAVLVNLPQQKNRKLIKIATRTEQHIWIWPRPALQQQTEKPLLLRNSRKMLYLHSTATTKNKQRQNIKITVTAILTVTAKEQTKKLLYKQKETLQYIIITGTSSLSAVRQNIIIIIAIFIVFCMKSQLCILTAALKHCQPRTKLPNKTLKNRVCISFQTCTPSQHISHISRIIHCVHRAVLKNSSVWGPVLLSQIISTDKRASSSSAALPTTTTVFD